MFPSYNNNSNITFPLCDIPPPTPHQCAQIPICGGSDYPNVTAMNSICSVMVSLSSCLGGFMWFDPKDPSGRPPHDPYIYNFSEALPVPNMSSPHCEDNLFAFTRACCPGYYCPPSMYCMLPCDQQGAYCPSSDTRSYPHCTHSAFAGVSGVLRYPQLLGCGGAYTPFTACPNGYYCTNSSSKQKCPRGYYCRDGTIEPFKCGLAIACPPGSSMPGDTVIAIIFIGILLLSLLFVIRFQQNKQRAIRLYRCMYKKYYRVEFDQRNKAYVETMFASKSQKDVIHSHKVPLLSEELVEFKDENANEENSSNLSGITDASDITMIDAKKLGFFMDIEFKNLSLRLKANEKTILENCSGKIHCGTINAIMGPSGAGKTSFLYTLCGKAASYGNISGDIYINDEKRAITDFKDIVGFVPQSDTMTASMTVKEMLEFNAQFRLGSDCGYHYRKSVVRDVLKLLKMKRIRHSLIGDDVNRGISGGQQKRVNIGMELVSQPSVLFLDEPTSGLDSSTSNDVMDVLKLIAKRGTTVVVVLHQPRYEIFRAFDNIILLAEGGKMVYMGNTNNAMPYFEQFGYIKPDMVNPADFLMDIVSGAVFPEDGRKPNLVETWEKIDKADFEMKVNEDFTHADGVNVIKDNSKFTPRKKMNFFSQTVMCTTRAVTTMFRQKWNMVADIIMICFIAFVAGFGCDSSNINKIPTNVYLTILSASIVGSIVSLKTFGNDRIMYWRFVSSGINRFSYFIGGTLASIPWILFEPLWFMMFYWPMAKPRGTVVVYYLLLVLGMFCVQGLAQFMSVCVDPNKATLAAVVIVMITNFFNGFEPTLTSLKGGFGEIISDCAYSRWQHEALWNEEINSWPQSFNSVKKYQQNHFGWHTDSENFTKDIIIMLVIGCTFRISTFLALVFVNRAKQI